jgi:SAM-dependent methyltransferase
MNGIIHLLCELGLSDAESIGPYFGRVRDRSDIAVLRCSRSGVILLDRTDHVPEAYYQNKNDLQYWNSLDRAQALLSTRADDCRRADAIADTVRGRRWLDIGTGLGGILDLLSSQAALTAAVEPQTAPRAMLRSLGYQMFDTLDAAPDAGFDLITLFHVYEHVADPVAFLRRAIRKLAPGGRICIEVPHARDALLEIYDCQAFRAFTLWSEHLILHTRESLDCFMAAAGLSSRTVTGIQRYPLANHLHWLAKARPGGHEVWDMLRDEELDRAYACRLVDLDRTDTLLAWGES